MKMFVYVLIITGLLGLGVFMAKAFGFYPIHPYLQNFEEEEFAEPSGFIHPHLIEDGLAIYKVGSGEPVLLLPYPHAHTKEPMAQGPIAAYLTEMGRSVITFDPPGAYNSTQNPVGDMAEMLASAEKTLNALDVDGPVDVVGHSMSGLVALAFAIEHPERTKSLVLVGAMSGFPAVLEYGMPKSTWKITDAAFWKFIYLGLKVKSGFGSLADHKALYNIMSRASFHDKSQFVPLEIRSDDYTQGIPIREIVWGRNLYKRLDYAERLKEVEAPTLILVGRHDPEAPLACSEELKRGIRNSYMVVFDQSGHSPYIEEPEKFTAEIMAFYENRLGE